jgi:hypothetical protein
VDGFDERCSTARTPGGLETCWNWRYELAGIVGSLLGPVHLDHAFGAGTTLGVVVTSGAVVVLSRTARRLVGRRLRVVWVQHRLRVGFVDAGLVSRLGYRPRLVWTRPSGDGERSWVWLPAGVAVAQVRSVSPVLAEATRAVTVEASPVPGHRHLVVLDVHRIPRRHP